MRAFALAALLLAAGGCLDIDTPDGTLTCNTESPRQCPHHFYCAWNNRCYRDGHPAPPPMDMSVRDAADDLSSPDLSMPADLHAPDDLTPPPDLTPTTD